MRELRNRPLNSFAALIVQDAIFRSKDWSHRITDVSDDFVLVRFPDALENLVRCCLRFDNSIVFVDKSLFELVMPAVLSAFGRSGASVRLIVRIDGSEPSDLLECLLLQGCHGFVTEGISRPSLKRVLRAVSVGEIAATRGVLSNAAQELFISEETLRWHLRNLYTKTDLGTRVELVEYAASIIRRNGGAETADLPRCDERQRLPKVRSAFSTAQ